MWNRKKSVNLSIIACFVVIAAVAVLMYFAPNSALFEVDKSVITKYEGFFDVWSVVTRVSVWASPFIVVFAVALLIKMLFNIKKGQTFVPQNVALLRVISWCCFLFAVLSAFWSIFLIHFLCLALAAGFAGLILRVVKNVMQSAVEMKQESELTI